MWIVFSVQFVFVSCNFCVGKLEGWYKHKPLDFASMPSLFIAMIFVDTTA